MKVVVLRTIESLLGALILAAAVHLVLILYFSGSSLSLASALIEAQGVATPTILLMGLILLRVLIRGHASLGKDLSAYVPTILFCSLLILYLANGVTKWNGDTVPARYPPLSILREGNFDLVLNEFPFLYTQGIPYYLRHFNERYVSNYPVGPAIAALPFYLLPALGGVSLTDGLIFEVEKLAAASMVALSACLLCLILRRLASQRLALLLTVIYVLGTRSFSVSSQALWQHGPSQLALTAGLYGLIRGREGSIWIALAGFALAFAVICRPTDLLLILPLGAYVILYHRHHLGLFLLGGLPPALFQLWYNSTYFGDPFFQPYGSAFWSTPLIAGLGGILLSPGRGLFVYSPILLWSFLGMALAWRRYGEPLVRAFSVGILATLLLYGNWINWWGGWSYGPRLLADLMPFLAICLVPCAVRLGTIHRFSWTFLGGRWLFLALAAWSIWAHALGAFWDDGRWNASPNIDLSPHRLWSLGSSPLVEYGKDVVGRVWIAIRGIPTSRAAPELLAAVYRHAPSSLNIIAPSSAAQCPVRPCITAVNTGQAVWLSTLGSDKGAVKLIWRWLKEGKEVSGLVGAAPLRHDIFPGRSYEFQLPFLPVPSEPGDYLLELEKARVRFGPFSGWGSMPVTIPITVPTWTPEVLLNYFKSPVVASTDAPELTIALDRTRYPPGEQLHINYQMVGAERPVLIDAYLAMRQPDDDVSLATVSAQSMIKPIKRFQSSEDPIHINQRFRFSAALYLPLLEELPLGHYTVYLFFTAAGSYQMLRWVGPISLGAITEVPQEAGGVLTNTGALGPPIAAAPTYPHEAALVHSWLGGPLRHSS